MVSQSDCCQSDISQLDCCNSKSVNRINASAMVSRSDCYQCDGQPIRFLPSRWSANQIVAISIFSQSDISQLDRCKFEVSQLNYCRYDSQPIFMLPTPSSADNLTPIRWSVNQIVANSLVSQSDCYQSHGQSIRLLLIRWSINQIVVYSMVNQSDCDVSQSIVANLMARQSDCCLYDGQQIRLLPIRWSANQIIAKLILTNQSIVNSMVSQTDC